MTIAKKAGPWADLISTRDPQGKPSGSVRGHYANRPVTQRYPPQGFALQDYGYLQSLDACGWLHELERRNDQIIGREKERVRAIKNAESEADQASDMLDEAGTKLESGDLSGARHAQSVVSSILCQLRATLQSEREPPQPAYIPAYIGPPRLRELSSEDIREYTVQSKHFRGLRLLAVDLSSPDRLLIEQFQKWLAASRAIDPLPIRRRGPKSTRTSIISATQFQQWVDNQIIPLCDLECSRDHRAKAYSNVELAGWLYPDLSRDSSEKKLLWARKMRNDALRLIPALWAQCQEFAEIALSFGE